MPDPQGLVAELETFVHDFPEPVHVAVAGAGHIDQVDGDNALVEPAVVLVHARLVVQGLFRIAEGTGIGKAVRGQEGTAAHAAIDIALEFPHHLGGNVVRHHPLGRAGSSQFGQFIVSAVFMDIVFIQNIDQFRERRGDPDTLFVLDTLHSLPQHLLDAHGEVFPGLTIFDFIQIHVYGHKRGLTVGCHQGDDLVLDRLNAGSDFILQTLFGNLVDLFVIDLHTRVSHLFSHQFSESLPADIDKRCQVGQGYSLTAVLVGSDLGNDLGGNVAGGCEAVRLLDLCFADDRAVLQHVFQVDQAAVVHRLGEVVRIMEMNDSLLVGIDDVLRQQESSGDVLGYFTGHVVTLGAVDLRVLVGILLVGLFVLAADQAQNLLVGCVGLADQGSFIPVGNVVVGQLVGILSHDLMFDHILDFFHGQGPLHLLAAADHIGRDFLYLFFRNPGCLNCCSIGFSYGVFDFFGVK